MIWKAILVVLSVSRILMGVEAPFAPIPPHDATNVLASGELSWAVKGTNTVANSGFEPGGPVSRWVAGDGRSIIATTARSFSGAYSVVLTFAGSRIMYQQLSLPKSNHITLSWADKLEHSAAPSNLLNWGLRVELRDTNNVVIDRIYSSPRILASTNQWALRSADISKHAGKIVRLTFTYHSFLDGGGAYLDDIIVSAVPNSQKYTAIISADPSFASIVTQQAISATASYTNLAPSQKYYWKVAAEAGEEVAWSPVWSFTTGPATNSTILRLRSLDSLQAGYPVGFSARAFQEFGLTTNHIVPIEAAVLKRTRPASLVLHGLTISNGTIRAMNVSTRGISLNGWSLTLYDHTTWPLPTFVFSFPSNVTVAPKGTFLAREKFVAPGAYPNFNLGIDLGWGASGPSALAAALLRDAEGACVDFVCAGSADARSITQPISIGIDQWRGNPLEIFPTGSLLRTGSEDTDTWRDWFRGGIPSINVPADVFQPGFEKTAIPVRTLSQDDEVWNGEIIFPEANTNLLLVARDGQGSVGELPLLNVEPAWEAHLATPATLQEGDDPEAIAIRAEIPYPLSTNLSVRLTASDPAIEVENFTIPAGETSAVFSLRLINDGVFNWERLITISGEAGFLKVRPSVIKIFDDEPVRITVVVPASVAETDNNFNGQVEIDEPAPIDVVVKLETSGAPAAILPATVMIMKGERTGAFEGRILNDGIMTGNRTVTITATVNFSKGAGVVTILDDEFARRRMSLIIPPRIVTHTNSRSFRCEAQLNAISSGYEVALSHDAGPLLDMPSQVVIPAGATSVFFNITVPGAAYDTPKAFLATAKAGDFLEATAPIEIKREEFAAYSLGANMQLFDKITQRLIVSNPTNNTIFWVNPDTGEVESLISVGSQPRHMALAEDGEWLYVALYEDHAIQRIRVRERESDLLIPTGAGFPRKVLVFHGTTNALGVVSDIAGSTEVAFYIGTDRHSILPGAGDLTISEGRIFANWISIPYIVNEVAFDGAAFPLGPNILLSQSPLRTGTRQDATGNFYSELDYNFTPESWVNPSLTVLWGNPIISTGPRNNFPKDPISAPIKSAPIHPLGWAQNRVAFIADGLTWVMRTDRLRSGPNVDLSLTVRAAKSIFHDGLWSVETIVSNEGPGTATGATVEFDFGLLQSVSGRSQQVSKGILRYSQFYPETIFSWSIGELKPSETQTCRAIYSTTHISTILGANIYLENTQPDPTPQGLNIDLSVSVSPNPTLKDTFLGISDPRGEIAFNRRDGVLIANNRGWWDLSEMRFLNPVPGWHFDTFALADNGNAVWGGSGQTLVRTTYPGWQPANHLVGPIRSILPLRGEPERIVFSGGFGFNPDIPCDLQIVTPEGPQPGKIKSGHFLRPDGPNSFFAYLPATRTLDRIQVTGTAMQISQSYTIAFPGDFFAEAGDLLYTIKGKVLRKENLTEVLGFENVEASVNVFPLPEIDRIIFALPGKIRVYGLDSRNLIGELPFTEAANMQQVFFDGDSCALTASGGLYFLRTDLLTPAPLDLTLQLSESGRIRIEFNTISRRPYRIESTGRIDEPWVKIADVSGTGNRSGLEIDPDTNARFYRVAY